VDYAHMTKAKTPKIIHTNSVPVRENILNVCGGKYKAFWQAHPEKLNDFMLTISKNGTPVERLMKLSPESWDAIMNSVRKPATGKTLQALQAYKADSTEINTAITNLKNGKTPSAETMRKIEDMTAYIEMQRIEQPITVYRDTGYTILNTKETTLRSGKTLGQELKEIAGLKNKAEIDVAIERLMLKENVIPQERFMSTTLCSDVRYVSEAPVRWELDLPKGTKGTFMETFNNGTSLGEQVEFLLQRGSQVIINRIELREGTWYIKGSIKQ